MNIIQEEIVDRQTVLHIELETEDLDPYLDRGYRQVANRIVIPGFRKGKAPRLMIERFLGRESLLRESLEFILPDVTERAISAQELETVGSPRIELLGMEPFALKATVALPPKVELGPYSDIRVDEVTSQVTEEQIQERLQRIREEAVSWEPVERPVKLGDMVTMDRRATVDSLTILDDKDEVYVVDVDNDLPLPGFAMNLEGVEAGTPAEFVLTLSEKYDDAALAGKEVHCTVNVSEVKERNLPELDDEFARGHGDGYESLDALRSEVELELKTEAQQAQDSEYRQSVVDELLGIVTMEIPPLLVDHEVEHMVQSRDAYIERLKIARDDYFRITGKTEEEVLVEFRENAASRLSRTYSLAKVAEVEGLEVSSGEVDAKIKEMFGEEGLRGESTEQGDERLEAVTDSVRESILMDKSLDRLAEIAKGEAADSVSAEQPQESPQKGDNIDDKA